MTADHARGHATAGIRTEPLTHFRLIRRADFRSCWDGMRQNNRSLLVRSDAWACRPGTYPVGLFPALAHSLMAWPLTMVSFPRIHTVRRLPLWCTVRTYKRGRQLILGFASPCTVPIQGKSMPCYLASRHCSRVLAGGDGTFETARDRHAASGMRRQGQKGQIYSASTNTISS